MDIRYKNSSSWSSV